MDRSRRPLKAERAQSRKAARQHEQVNKLFEHRYLFVRHRLTANQKKTLQRITRGLAHSATCGRSWKRSTGCLTAAVGRGRCWLD